MINTLERQQLANITNLKIVSHDNKHFILAEWSLEAIEAFDDYVDAQDFVKGFMLQESNNTLAYRKGRLFRSFVETDIKLGAKYYKVTNVLRY